ncbi:MAG: hypothetical protein WB566_09640 [Terriglobales bacterium]
MRALLLICLAIFLEGAGWAQNVEVHVPASVVAGSGASISTSGSGRAIFYLAGPGISRKNEIRLGEEIQLRPQEMQNAGAYQAIVCSDSCASATFYVTAAKPDSLSFLVHPSRVPVSQSDAVSGVALPFDQFHNFVLTPVSVNFQLNAAGGSLLTRAVRTQDGVAWFRAASGRSAEALQAIAAVDDLSVRRVVQQVASDPCNLRIEGQRVKTGILVQTEPVHDCAGNPVPDGTIVTFTATEANGKSTVDAPIKQGIARAQISGPGGAVISVASGVVMGNEIRVGAQP